MDRMSQGYGLAMLKRWLITVGILALLLVLPVYAGINLAYWESKGPFKNWMQVVDWDGDGDPDLVVSHTRWEKENLSWAGIGVWINHGDGTFNLYRDRGTGSFPFRGFAAAAGDIDQDGDMDMFTQDFRIRLMVNQGGSQHGEPGDYRSLGGIDSPPAYDQGYRDMGGTITLADLNGDSLTDAFVAGCCYGMDPRENKADTASSPSVSWVWINTGMANSYPSGYILPLDFLDGRPIRAVAIGDVDGDGDPDVIAAVGKPSLGTSVTNDDLILLNDGSGRLAVYDQPLGNTDSTSVALGDVNGDGLPDALIGTSTGANLWINQGPERPAGSPLFSRSETSFPAHRTAVQVFQSWFSLGGEILMGLELPYGGIRTKAVFLADLDGDGDLDALLCRILSAEIWWGDGQAGFERSEIRFEYREDTGAAVADLDGDGDADLFFGRNESDYEAWWNDGQGVFGKARP